jgi:hypothetical protein
MGEELESKDESLESGFDLVAAQVRADATDVDTFFKVLATKLQEALGERVRLERAGGLLKRDRPVTGIELDLAAGGTGPVLSARRERGGLCCTVSRRVRGVALSTKEVPMSQWIEELVSALGDDAKRSEQTWRALHSLLT